jgi:transcriptional regulator with XRE-family HTH domain
VNTHSDELSKLLDPAYRSAFVASQINIQVPFQIRALRKQRGWTQPDLAKKADMKQPRISAMERPGGANFTLETLKRLADAFGVALVVHFAPFGELLDWSDRFSPDDFMVPSFEQELPELEARCSRASLSVANLGAGAELRARPTEMPLDEVRRAELLSRPRNQQQGPPERIPPGAALAAMGRARQA